MFMKNTLLIIGILSCTFAMAQKSSSLEEKEPGAYLFVFFSDHTHSIFMATSHDGYTFTAVNDGQPVIAGDTIAEQRGVRDPHIYRGFDGAFLSVYDRPAYFCQTRKITRYRMGT